MFFFLSAEPAKADEINKAESELKNDSHFLLQVFINWRKITPWSRRALGVNAIRWCGEYDRLYTAGRDSIIRKWSLQDDEASGDFPNYLEK